jgi:hypothetical protein
VRENPDFQIGITPGHDRKNIRSKTPDGFERAVFMANTGVEGAAEAIRQPLLFHQADLFDP